MKKFLFFLICALFFASTSFGQWIVGPRIGANFFMLSGKWTEDDDSKNKFVLGPVVGAVGGYEISELLSVNAELLLIKMGGKTKFTYSEEESRSQTEQEYWIRERFNCIQLAVPVRANFGDNFNFFANVGPYCTYKFGGKWKDSDGNDGKIKWGTDNTGGDASTWYLDPKYNGRFDFGFYFGGGAGKKIGPGRLEVDLRFGLGLIDLNKFENKDQKQAAKDNGYKAYKSRNISISFAYLFGLGGDSPTRFYE